MSLPQYITRISKKEHSSRARLVSLALDSLIFLFGIPAFLFWLSRGGSDCWRFNLNRVLSVCSLVASGAGLLLGLWTVWVQFQYARGTPVPIMATQRLLTEKPYALCRNPMVLGTLVFYFGIAVFTASLKPVLAVLLFSILLLTYVKLIEEKEMLLRFDGDYLRYKQRTPFVIPRLSAFRRRSAARTPQKHDL